MAIQFLRKDVLHDKRKTQLTTVLLIHKFLRRRWDTGLSYEGRNPHATANAQHLQLHNRPRKVYLQQSRGAVEASFLHDQWRNNVCDCLYGLHWETLSSSARAGGWESSVFLQLHLARLVILALVAQLLNYVLAAIKPVSVLLPHTIYQSIKSDTGTFGSIATWASQDRF